VNVSADSTKLKFGVAIGGIVIAVALMAVAAVFANAYGATRASEDAAALHRAETMLSASAVLRSQVGQAALVNTYASIHEDAGESLVTAEAEARTALAVAGEAATAYAEFYEIQESGFAEASDQYLATASGILQSIAAGETELANLLVGDRFNNEYGDLTAVVIGQRDQTVNDLSSAETAVGRISEVSRFLVAFLIPSLAILLYRWAAARQQRQQELEMRLDAQRQLTQAKDEFVANVSHELRTPLTSIYGFAQLLAEGGTDDEETTTELVNLIRAETDELSRMVEDLLTAARADAGALAYHLEEFSVANAVDNAIAALVRSGQRIDVTVMDAFIHADDFRFRQIIRNLISNSRKYGAEPIGLRGVVLGDRYHLTVYDHGEGVPVHVQERLFQRFVHQGHQPLLKGSVGLGLSIVRTLAQGMNGDVSYERVGDETRFIVSVPLAERVTRGLDALAS
jgi:signal transduction histidine kinase